MDQPRYILPSGTSVKIEGHVANPRPKLILTWLYHVYGSGGLGGYELSGFYAAGSGALQGISCQNLEIVFTVPSAEQSANFVPSQYCALLGGNYGAGPAMTLVEIVNCTLTRPEGSSGAIIGGETRAAVLTVNHSNYNVSEMADAWVTEIAAGTPVVDVPMIISNLDTL